MVGFERVCGALVLAIALSSVGVGVGASVGVGADAVGSKQHLALAHGRLTGPSYDAIRFLLGGAGGPWRAQGWEIIGLFPIVIRLTQLHLHCRHCHPRRPLRLAAMRPFHRPCVEALCPALARLPRDTTLKLRLRGRQVNPRLL